METLKYDAIVIGSGPGGQKAAVQAAQAGKRVVLIEKERKAGGSSLFRGTIPSKTLRESALTIARLKHNSGYYRFEIEKNFEIVTLMGRLDKVLEVHNRFIDQYLEDNHIDYCHGKAKLTGEHTVQVTAVDGSVQNYEAEHIVIATGSRPRTPPGIPVDHENILDSDSILSMIYIPRSLTVIGGGVIGSEYASIFSMLGVEVTLIDKSSRPLSFMDGEITGKFVDNFKRHGGTYMGEKSIQSIQWDGVSQVVTKLESAETIKSDKMLVCQGRSANVEQLGLESVGIKQGKYGHIEVDERYRTNVPNVLAVGDVIGPPALASTSMEQGRRAMCHALGEDPGHAFELVPIGIYAVPEIASVGLNEEQAVEKYGDVVIGRAKFDEVSRGVIAGIEDGMLKMVADKNGDKLLGVQIVGEGATDLIHVGEMALLQNGSVSMFLENIFNYPTLSGAYRVAAHNLINKVRK